MFVSFTAFLLPLFASPQGTELKLPIVAAPIVYKDLMLVIVDRDTVAAVVFDEEIDSDTEKGVRYRYRGIARDGKMYRGAGAVAERIRYMKTDNPRIVEGVDIGSVLMIKAGAIGLKWGFQGVGRGWIYYLPEQMSVYLAHRDDFAELNLSRFRRK